MKPAIIVLGSLAVSLLSVRREAPPAAVDPARADAAAAIRSAALVFLESLGPELREQATFAFDHDERKLWSNLPHTMFERLGVRFGEMSTQQRVLAHRLVQSALSSRGYLKVSGIMHVDQILAGFARRGAGGGGADAAERTPMFGHDFYWIGIFGDPAGDARWGWQLDGHHLALNFTVVGDAVSVTPAFLGADPAEVRDGAYSGFRVLGAEDDKGRRLFESLDDAQRAVAVIAADAPRDVIAGPGRGDALKERAGLPVARLTPAQRQLLLQLIEEYANNLEHDLAHTELARIRAAGLDEIHFAWAGTEPGKPYYYRIHGPTVLIEFDNSYAPGRSAGPVNHIHTVWRDLQNDYGEDLLRAHYESSPHHRDR